MICCALVAAACGSVSSESGETEQPPPPVNAVGLVPLPGVQQNFRAQVIQFDFTELPPLPLDVSTQVINPDGKDGIYRSPPLTEPGPGCDEFSTCFQNDRFQLDLLNAEASPGTMLTSGVNSGMFFFSPDSVDAVVTLVNGCDINNRFWVSAATTYDVEFDLTVTDTVDGGSKTYRTPLGAAAVLRRVPVLMPSKCCLEPRRGPMLLPRASVDSSLHVCRRQQEPLVSSRHRTVPPVHQSTPTGCAPR